MTPFETLGIGPGATPEEIKSAYRKKVFEQHPDRNQGDPKAEEKLKAINEAYEAIKSGRASSQRQYQASQHHQQPNWSDDDAMFAELFNHGIGGMPSSWKRTVNWHGGRRRFDVNVSLRLAETLQAQERVITIQDVKMPCSACFGSGTSKQPCVSCKESCDNDKQRCPMCKGNGHHYGQCHDCHGSGNKTGPQTFRVNIPRGIIFPCTLQQNAQQGVVFVNITIDVGDAYTIGNDGRLLQDVYLPYETAVLGGVHKLELIDGTSVNVKVPPLRNKQMIKLAGKGVYAGPAAKERGDLYLVTHVDIPQSPSDEYKTTVAALRSITTHSSKDEGANTTHEQANIPH